MAGGEVASAFKVVVLCMGDEVWLSLRRMSGGCDNGGTAEAAGVVHSMCEPFVVVVIVSRASRDHPRAGVLAVFRWARCVSKQSLEREGTGAMEGGAMAVLLANSTSAAPDLIGGRGR